MPWFWQAAAQEVDPGVHGAVALGLEHSAAFVDLPADALECVQPGIAVRARCGAARLDRTPPSHDKHP